MAFNIALLADDAMDGYLQYTAAQKQIAAEKRRRQQVSNTELPKHANVLEDKIYNMMCNPRSALPSYSTLGLSAAGIIASAYAPEWAGGPTEGEDKISPKRALKALVSYNVLGRSIQGVPTHLQALINDARPLSRASHAAHLLPPLALAGSVAVPLARGEEPKGEDIVRNFRRASYLSALGTFAHPDVLSAMGRARDKIIAEANSIE